MAEVSIIIPMHNATDYIEKCLSSLMDQDYGDYEIIIVDDGSTDNTIGLVKSFSKVILKKQKHGGPGKARNFGTKFSKGEIILLPVL